MSSNKSKVKSHFQSLSLPEKLEYLNDGFIESVKEIDEKLLNPLLRQIVLNPSENGYVRKSVLQLFTDFVILGKIKTRHAYSLLIDDWQSNDDTFLELQRIKDLLLYYEPSDEESESIESIFIEGTVSLEAEIIGESFHNLGIIYLKKALVASSKEEYKINLEKGSSYFKKSTENIENRIDSDFNQKVILILKELLINKWNLASNYIKELANNLFQMEAFSFQYSFDSLQFGLYKILTSLQQICIQQPKDWIDYRLELDKVYLNYQEITNSKVNTRLSEKSLIEKIGDNLKNNILEPFFTLNLYSDISKIDVLIRGYLDGSDEKKFLQYLKRIIENNDKRQTEQEYLKAEFSKLFPKHNQLIIDQVIGTINSNTDYIKAFEKLSRKDNENLIEHIIYACAKLQGDKKYWGNSVNENDRNRYIATLLEASGYTIKDQPQWSTSTEGKDSGEVDVFITEPNGTPRSIIEALILDSLKKDYLIEHLDKLFRYDTTGLKNNYILTYSLSKNFDSFWNRYKVFVSKHNYEHKFLRFEELYKNSFTDIKIGIANHMRNGKKINLYHLMINLVER